MAKSWSEMAEKMRELASDMVDSLEHDVKHPPVDSEGNVIDVTDRLGKLSVIIRSHLAIESRDRDNEPSGMDWGEQVKK